MRVTSDRGRTYVVTDDRVVSYTSFSEIPAIQPVANYQEGVGFALGCMTRDLMGKHGTWTVQVTTTPRYSEIKKYAKRRK